MEKKYNFDKTFDVAQNGFNWMNCPDNFSFTSKGLSIDMDSNKDFWNITYTKPHVIKQDGHFLHKSFPVDQNVMIETKLEMTAVNQFDQAGIMLYHDDDHWIKAGLEYIEGKYKLSCVVTNTFSDWSTQDHMDGNLNIRLYKLGEDVVVEFKSDDDAKWNLLRICRANVDEVISDCKFGLYACAPKDKSGNVCYDHVIYKTLDDYEHTR